MSVAFDTDSWIDVAAAKAAGASALGGYLGDRNLTTVIAQEAAEADMGIFSFWEGASSNPDGGAPQGRLDADTACDAADALGVPLGAAIYLPNDQAVASWSATLAYFQAAAETVISRGRVPGFYGQTSVWDEVKGFGYRYFVHAHDGTDPPYPEANIVQGVSAEVTVGGMTCDVDEIQTTDFGGWNADGLWPKPVVVDPPADPPTDPPEDTMLIFNFAGQPNRVLTSAGTYFDLADEESKAFLVKYFGAKLAPGCGEPTVAAPDEIPVTLLAVFKAA